MEKQFLRAYLEGFFGSAIPEELAVAMDDLEAAKRDSEESLAAIADIAAPREPYAVALAYMERRNRAQEMAMAQTMVALARIITSIEDRVNSVILGHEAFRDTVRESLVTMKESSENVLGGLEDRVEYLERKMEQG